MLVTWANNYCHPLPPGHRFPMEKYDLLPEQLLREGTILTEHLFSPDPLREEDILLLHHREYWEKLRSLNLSKSEERKTGFPVSAELVDRERTICGGTLAGARYALESGLALNVAGGTHHAFANRGEGFCLLNDQALAAAVLLEEGAVNRVLFVDLDVHQGNGTASILQGDNRCFTFSMHGANNYPLHKETSTLDIPLPDGADDRFYLKTLEAHLERVIDEAQPDILFYQSGVDILETDKLGRLGVSLQGCKRRDETVLKACKRRGIPVQVSMGGGYSPDLRTILEAHANTYRVGMEVFY